ncbi:unnamed protein product [Sphenostylis stenocarpa]|uniref:Phytocyanin domain-containing protein n=1 Tax=Sphenostylis stenocarpa TaxID=92480 RepID=A0AA86W586_9FABA|nr:unnamed protein product [Sphenostylis stenocarpa]
MDLHKPLCLFLFLLTLLSSSQARKFNVGGSQGWVPNPSEGYNNWAGRNRFQINDTIVFKYQKGSDSVLEVKKEDYDKCNMTNPIKKFEDGDTEFKFDRSGPFYFISGTDGNCEKGQKLIVVVLSPRTPPQPLPPSSPPNLSPLPPSPKLSPSSPSVPPKPSLSPSLSPLPSPSLPPISSPSPSTKPNPPTVSPSIPPFPVVQPPLSSPTPANAPTSVTLPPIASPAYSPPAPSPPQSAPSSSPPQSAPSSSPPQSAPSNSTAPSSNNGGFSAAPSNALVYSVTILVGTALFRH